MRSAVVLVSLVAAIAAEAPYHLPRPAPNAPSFHYPSAPAPPPPAPYFPPQPAPPPPPPPPPSRPNYNSGYNYERPSVQPALVQPPRPQIQYPAQQIPQPQPQPIYLPQPFPQPQPQPISYFPRPSNSYGLPQLQIAPRPILQPIPQIQPQPIPPQIQPQPLPIIQPQPLPQPIYSLPQPQFQPQPAQIYQPVYQQQPSYSYQQPQPIQPFQQLTLQAQPLSNNAASSSLSSYQADSNQYSGAQQTHSEALDSVVIGHVQNIIRDDEHSSAKNAGYQSLVSGISLENVKPSVEISSFVQSSPLRINQSSGSSASQSSVSSSTAVAASGPSGDYGLPIISANSQSSQDASISGFLPQTQPSTSYGTPN
ncbi:uncharacterized protein ACR2FA_007686 [Aphomia sociella]